MRTPAVAAPPGGAASPFGPAVATPAGLSRVPFRAMGTDVEVLVPEGREVAAASVVAVFADWERRCSRFDPASELSRLNARAGAPVVVSGPLFDAIATALAAARATDGVFDPTVLHRLEDLGYDRTFAAIVTDDTRAAGDPQRGRQADNGAPGPWTLAPWVAAWRAVRLDRRTRTVDLPVGTGLDLGGIAKGMAVDTALATLEAQGLRCAAVNAGGDLAVLGIPPGTDAWWVAVDAGDGGTSVAVASGALATSSTVRRRWTRGGRTVHHLVDPRTGMPTATGLASVTVAAASCAQAEVAAKTALILGPVDGTEFIERTGLSGLTVGDDGVLRQVGRWLDRHRPAAPGADRAA